MLRERNAFVLHTIVIVVISMSLRSNGMSSDKECITKPEGLLHSWNTEELLKINIFIPPHWWRRPENSYLYFSTTSNISFILNSTEINLRSEDFGMTNFISFQSNHRPVAGWTSIFLFIRDNSIQMEDQDHNPLIKYPASQNSQLNNFTGHEILRLIIKGMNAVVNCDQDKRTFSASPHTSDHNENKIKIPVTLFNDGTKVSFYSNDSMQIFLVHGDDNATMICKEFMDPKSDTLQLRNPEEIEFCALLPKKHYYLNVSSSMLDKRNIERNGNLKIGFLNLYSRNKILIMTDAFINISKRISQLTDQQTGTSFHFLPPLIIVSAILTVVIIAGIGAVVWRTVRLKMKKRQEQLYSSESWTQQDFDTVRSSTLYIKNTSYESTGAQGGKKFSISSDDSSPADEEYDEPIYSDGRESIYESIYESGCSPPVPPELPKEFVK